jgi:hypothetical protein
MNTNPRYRHERLYYIVIDRVAQIYAVIRLVTDTCIKNGQNILDAFKTIAILQAE